MVSFVLTLTRLLSSKSHEYICVCVCLVRERVATNVVSARNVALGSPQLASDGLAINAKHIPKMRVKPLICPGMEVFIMDTRNMNLDMARNCGKRQFVRS